MTPLETTCKELHQRYETVGDELTRLELKLVAPGFQAKEAKSGKARELQEEVKVLRLRLDEGLQRINEMHAASGEDLETFKTEVGGMADDLEVQVKRLTTAWNENFGGDSVNEEEVLSASAARLAADTTT